MPRYFFIVAYADQRAVDDRDGTALPDDTAAVEYARRLIDDLRDEVLPGEAEPTIILKNDEGKTIYRFPAS